MLWRKNVSKERNSAGRGVTVILPFLTFIFDQEAFQTGFYEAANCLLDPSPVLTIVSIMRLLMARQPFI